MAQKALEENIPLNEQSKRIVLKESVFDGRSLRSSLLKLKAREILDGPRKDFSFPQEVVENVCLKFNIDVKPLYSNSRKKQFIMARHISMYLMSKGLGISFFRIGQMFKRDHPSVLYAVAKVEDKILQDASFAGDLRTACDQVKSKKLPWPESACYN